MSGVKNAVKFEMFILYLSIAIKYEIEIISLYFERKIDVRNINSRNINLCCFKIVSHGSCLLFLILVSFVWVMNRI